MHRWLLIVAPVAALAVWLLFWRGGGPEDTGGQRQHPTRSAESSTMDATGQAPIGTVPYEQAATGIERPERHPEVGPGALLIEFVGIPPSESRKALVSWNRSWEKAPRGTLQMYPPTNRRVLPVQEDRVLLVGLRERNIEVRVRVEGYCPAHLPEVDLTGRSRLR